MKNIITIILLLSLSGCSFLWQGNKSQLRPNPEICSDSVVPPVIDALSSTLVFTAAGLTTELDIEDNYRYYFMASGIIIGSVYSLSSITGILAASKCKAEK